MRVRHPPSRFPATAVRRRGRGPGAVALAAAAAFACAAQAVDSIQVLGLFADRAVVEIDGKRRVLEPGRTSPEGVTLITADSESAVLEIDGQRRTLSLGRRITTVFRPPAAGRSIQVWPNQAGMYRIVGSINGYPVNFLVDTGATFVAMNRVEAKRLGIDYLVEGAPSRSQTAAGIVDTYHVRLRKIRVGDIIQRDVQASVVDGDFPREVLLGNSFLNRLDLRRKGRMLELRER